MTIDESFARRFSFESIHNIRLFPKNLGPCGYQITGIAKRCDWQVMSCTAGGCHLFRNSIENPRTIFLSFRGLYPALEYFMREVLPAVRSQFVLISGSEDMTLPNQLDRRWPAFDDTQKDIIEQIRRDERLIAWYAENLDELRPKMKPLPTGHVFADSGAPIDFVEVAKSSLSTRPLKAFCAHRIRTGAQWAPREQVSKLCQSDWKSFTTLLQEEVSLEVFMGCVRAHPFVLCVEGGGLDPSPKAWLTLALGSIPVMRRSATTAAYESALPVVLVDNWEARSLSIPLMQEWRNQLSPWFDHGELRELLEYKLSIDYWWKHIQSTLLHADNAPF